MLARFLLLVATRLLCSGCFATIVTRGPYDAVGRYPGYAVYIDARWIGPGVGPPDSDNTLRIAGILSIMPDLVIDTILLPVDHIAWPFGCKRDSY